MAEPYRSDGRGFEPEHVWRPVGTDHDLVSAPKLGAAACPMSADVSSRDNRSAGAASIPQIERVSGMLDGEMFAGNVQVLPTGIEEVDVIQLTGCAKSKIG